MRLSPSLYAADPMRLGEQIEALAPYVASFHVDVMDGSFAPTFGLGERAVRALVARSPLPIDVHLMVDSPGKWVRMFAEAGARRIAFHLEAVDDPCSLATDVRAGGALPYLALQPTTPLTAALPLLDFVHGVLLLTAPAGGGTFDEAALERTTTLPASVPIIVDGGIGPAHFETLLKAKVELVVVGRTLFDAPDVAERARDLNRELRRVLVAE